MTDLDKGFPGGGGAEPPRLEAGSMPFFPAPPAPAGGAPLPPVPAAPPADAATPVVKGRVTIEDQVIEKIAVLAALEVDGVADAAARASWTGSGALGGSGGAGEAGGPASLPAASGRPLGEPHPHGHEVSLELGLTVAYGCPVMDVARQVRADVARMAGRMLGVRVVAVDISVEDVRPPAARNAANTR
ncbi:Asp23/Gls24 family envelope stress response protein [Spirillospora sp. NPDC029432]|uniref:Asp23/Gls24 family envelope stress response protein n=1 Tax=Spirillospora sp. NPDC029432 TaxID=3154599 RepID=UPI003456C096